MPIRRRSWLIVTAIVGALTAAAAINFASRIPFSSDALRSRVVATLADRLDAEVELQDLTLRIYPRLHATGRGLTIRFEQRHDVPPLVSIDRFTVDADLIGLWRRRVAKVALDGLAINIPPDDDEDETPRVGGTPATSPDSASGYARDVIIEELDAPDAQLTILRRDPAKPPRIWYMHRLKMRRVGLLSRMPFETLLTNAVPPGQINASGTFGPWMRADPGTTPLAGQFTFENADLSVFKGISGILSARGTFDGSLDRIAISGQTDTPDFMINLSGHQLPLRTTYRAVVDGTNGNTTLDPVDATILDTRIVARGGVFEVEGQKGRVVKLDVAIDQGRLEDIMRMAVKTPRPTMSGGLTLTTALTIPPGPQDVAEKLGLDGRFEIARGSFTDRGVQAKVNELSRRASGRKATEGENVTRVTSNFAGRFTLANGRLSLSPLTFDVPGAVVAIRGAYSLKRETLAFSGDLHMDAKLSQTTTGFKSLLLKVADPLFRRQGKTVVPLTISGTRNDPKFGLDVKRVFQR
ncbi:MAG TPA: AsmA-like C-terminal region-containing protein [Vicinamibacterales bacterium]|nr:AsmA-like C-terminal region-containing protein [Vicinamibacterales bacterium]